MSDDSDEWDQENFVPALQSVPNATGPISLALGKAAPSPAAARTVPEPEAVCPYLGLSTDALIAKIKELEKTLKSGPAKPSGKKEQLKARKKKEREALEELESEHHAAQLERMRTLTPAEQLALKLEQMEDADRKIALDTFGLSDSGAGQLIESFNPTNADQFEKMACAIAAKCVKYSHCLDYLTFLDSLFRKVIIDRTPDDMERAAKALHFLASEVTKDIASRAPKLTQKKDKRPPGAQSKQQGKKQSNDHLDTLKDYNAAAQDVGYDEDDD